MQGHSTGHLLKLSTIYDQGSTMQNYLYVMNGKMSRNGGWDGAISAITSVVQEPGDVLCSTV
jgi:hypothetical protein